YRPIVRAYLHNSDLNGVDQTGDVALRIEGSKTLIKAFARYTELSGTDRLSGTFVSGSLINLGVQGSYQIAPRTSLVGILSGAMSNYTTNSVVGSNIYTSEFGAYWAATERLSFGPALRYSITESDNISTRDSWALMMQAQYLVGERIRFMGSLGLEYAANSEGNQQSTLGLTGKLSASYAINERWSWSNDVDYVTVPSPTETGYVINNLAVTTALTRQLLRATADVGLEYNLSNYESVNTVSTNLANENNLSVYLGYERKLFAERVTFLSRVSYTLNNGQKDWSQLQISAGLAAAF
ncbi:MAG: hypothetical protein ABI600_09250, partial [Luteolibacter sp.]